jgi:tetratricopeptide (TPR) repeat protein
MGFCWEGIGVPMDLRITNKPEDIRARRDRVLEFALDFIERGEPSPRDVSSSVADIRESLAMHLERELESLDPDAAIARAKALRGADHSAYHVDEDELLGLAVRLAANGREPAAALVLQLAADEFPESHRAWQLMGEGYLRRGDADRARVAFSTAAGRNRRSYPWEKQAAEVAEAVLNGKKLLVPALEGARSDDDFAQVLRDFGNDPETYFLTESAVNSLGYRLLGANQVDRAIEVFLINTIHFPRSANVWDSLGDGYRAKGQIEQAIASYQRALEIDPNFAASRRNLAELQQEQR